MPSTIDIFPANDAAPWPQGFSHGMEFSHGGTTVSQCVANGAGQGIDFFPPTLSGQTSPALPELLTSTPRRDLLFLMTL